APRAAGEGRVGPRAGGRGAVPLVAQPESDHDPVRGGVRRASGRSRRRECARSRLRRRRRGPRGAPTAGRRDPRARRGRDAARTVRSGDVVEATRARHPIRRRGWAAVSTVRSRRGGGAELRWVAALPSVLVLLTALPPPITGQATEYSGEIIVDGGVEDLVGISSIVPFDDGSIAVGQGQDHRVIVFGPDGARRAVLGRAGGGPGEFRDLSSRSGRAGQLVWVWDRSARRLTLLDARGRLVRTTQAPIALSSPDGVTQPGIAASQPLALGPDGGLLLLLTVPRAMMSLRGWEDLQGHRTGSVWVTDGRRGTVVAGWPTATETCGTEPAQQMNCPVPRVAAGPDGRLLVIVSVEPDGSAQGTFAVRAFGRDGRLRFESHL